MLQGRSGRCGKPTMRRCRQEPAGRPAGKKQKHSHDLEGCVAVPPGQLPGKQLPQNLQRGAVTGVGSRQERHRALSAAFISCQDRFPTRPHAIHHPLTTPKLYTSLAGVAASPLSSSGACHSGLVGPPVVADASPPACRILERLKSDTLARQCSSTRMLGLLTARAGEQGAQGDEWAPERVTAICTLATTPPPGSPSLCTMGGSLRCRYSRPLAASAARPSRRCHVSAAARSGARAAFLKMSNSEPRAQYSVMMQGGVMHRPMKPTTPGKRMRAITAASCGGGEQAQQCCKLCWWLREHARAGHSCSVPQQPHRSALAPPPPPLVCPTSCSSRSTASGSRKCSSRQSPAARGRGGRFEGKAVGAEAARPCCHQPATLLPPAPPASTQPSSAPNWTHRGWTPQRSAGF